MDRVRGRSRTPPPAARPAEAPPEALRRTFVHVGYPKCASTWLQRAIFPQLGNFSDIAGVRGVEKYCLFRDGADPSAFRELAERCLERPDPERGFRVVSYEGLVEMPFRGFEEQFLRNLARRGHDPERYTHRNAFMVERLRHAWPDARILIVVREQWSWAVSRYKMYYRNGHTREPIAAFLDELGEGYDRAVERYAEAFGAENVRVVPYELLEEDPAAFARAVTGFVDPGIEPAVPTERANAARPLRRTDEYERARRQLRHRLRPPAVRGAREGPGRRVALGLGRLWLASVQRGWLWLRHGDRPHRVAIDDATRRRLGPGLARSNRRLAELTGLDLARYGYVLDESGVGSGREPLAG